MSPKARESEATAKTPDGVARAAPRCGSPARVPSSVNTPAEVEEPSARKRVEANDDNIFVALAVVNERLSNYKYSQQRMLEAVGSGMFASKLGVNMRGRPNGHKPA